jgi:hypothetical protein
MSLKYMDCAHGVPMSLPCGACSEATSKPINAESDPTGAQPHEPGAKLDAGKAPVFRGAIDYFPRALEAVAAISAFGASKYTWRGWESVPDGINRYSDALARHLVKQRIEGDNDADSGMLHAAHAAWNALARLELILRQQETANDR